MNLGDLLKTLAANSGIESSNKDLQALLDSPSLLGQEVPDSIVSQIQSNLFSIDAAKNNPTLINHFRAQHYNGVDAELDKTFNELSLEDAVIAELKNEKSTPKRVSLALKKIAELEKAKIGASKGDKAELQKEIEALNGKLKQAAEAYEAEKRGLIEKHENDLFDNDFNTLLSGYKFALPDEMDMGLKLNTAKAVVNKFLEGKDAKAIRDNGSIKLIKKSTGTDYYDEKNSKVEFKSFVDAALGQNKLLKTTETPKQQQSFTTRGSDPGNIQTSPSWDAAAAESLSQVANINT